MAALDDLLVVNPVTVSDLEDAALVAITLTATDPDGDGTPLAFRLEELPTHGELYTAPPFLGGMPVLADADYQADFFDAGTWYKTLYFIPDANWSGTTGFDFSASGATGGPASVTISLDPVTDAPIVDANVNDGAEPDGLAVNVTSSNSADESPAVATLADGGTLVVWQQGLLSTNIVARPYAGDGTPLRGFFTVTNLGGPSEIQPVVAGKPDGSFAIAWVQQGAATGGADIPVAFFNPGATSPTLFVVAIGSENAIESAPSIAALPDGWVVVATTDAGGGDTAIRIQSYAADLTAEPPLTVLAGASAATVAPLGASGDYVVIGTFPDGSIRQVVVSGGIAGAPVDVFDGPGGSDSQVTPLADGGYVVVWTHDDGAGNNDLYGRIYDETGAASTGTLLLTDTPFASEFAADVAALPDGRFVVAWVGNKGVGPSQDIFAQLFAFDGTPIGAPIPVTATGNSPVFPSLPIDETQPTITVHEDGRFTVGWLQAYATGSNNPDVLFRTYSPSEVFLSGVTGEPITLPTTVALADTDGSEVLASVRIAFLPTGFTLPVGERSGTDWVIDRSSAAEADFLDALVAGTAALTVTAPYGYSGFLNLAIVATSRETGDPGQAVTGVGVVPFAITDPARLDLNGIDAGTDAGATFIEDGAATLIAPAALVLGGSDTDLDGARLELTLGNAEAADQLEIVSDGSGPGQIDLAGNEVRFGGVVIGTRSGGAGAPLAVTFNASASPEAVEALLRQIAFSNSSDDPSPSLRTAEVTLMDASSALVSEGMATIGVTPVEDAADAQPDGNSIDEDGTIAGASLFGNDADPDGPPLAVAQVNGAASSVGNQIMLASGALLTVDADGTYDYDPNGGFGYLISAANGLATGAVNTSAIDSFTYTLAGGETATVTITIQGVESPDDELHGDAGENVITGTSDPDRFRLGQGGDDIASGLGGNDLFVFGNAFDGLDVVDGGTGFDTIILEGDYATVPLVIPAAAMTGVERILANGGFSYDITVADAGIAAGSLFIADGSALLSGEAFTFDGSADTDAHFLLLGGGGDDALIGGGVEDVLYGGAGVNDLDGNGGIDRVDYTVAAGPVDVDLGSGIANDNGFGGSDSLEEIENVTGSAFADILVGSSLANVIDGGLGADQMTGGDGDDTYGVDNAGDMVSETSALGGIDTVRSSIGYTLGANLETLFLIGAAAVNGTGNALDNNLTGNSAANMLNGGIGADRMKGDGGDDIFIVDNVGDVVIENFLTEGVDTVRSSVSFTLNYFVDNLVLTGAAAIDGTGNGLVNNLTGNNAANVLNGGAGADRMKGDGGDDTYVVDNVGDVVIENSALDGTDTVLANVGYTLGSFVENLTLTGGGAIGGTGNGLANVITGNNAANLLQGMAGGDTLMGAGGADTLQGGIGDDNLLGGGGHDDLHGGAGQDGFRFDTALSAARNVDDILDFNVADDSIFLDRDIFAGIAADGALAAGAFRTGTTALDGDDRILYDAVTGQIRYDADGAGGSAAILFATVTPGTALTSADFVLV